MLSLPIAIESYHKKYLELQREKTPSCEISVRLDKLVKFTWENENEDCIDVTYDKEKVLNLFLKKFEENLKTNKNYYTNDIKFFLNACKKAAKDYNVDEKTFLNHVINNTLPADYKKVNLYCVIDNDIYHVYTYPNIQNGSISVFIGSKFCRFDINKTFFYTPEEAKNSIINKQMKILQNETKGFIKTKTKVNDVIIKTLKY